MDNPIIALQAALVAAFAGAGLDVVDAPPRGMAPPFVVIGRHDFLVRDGDAAPHGEHLVVLTVWGAEPGRRGVAEIADRLVRVALAAPLAPSRRLVTHRRHERTQTDIETKTGRARASVTLRFFTEPEED